jgi:hypothetical protein
MRGLIARIAIQFIAIVAVATPANATSVDVGIFPHYTDWGGKLNQSNENTDFPDGVEYLQVTISDGIAGAIDFLVETLAPLSGIADSNYGIQSFSFNFGDSGAALAQISDLPAGWSSSGDQNHSGYGVFDAHISGTGGSRQDPLEFSITGVLGDTPFDYLTTFSTGNAGEGNQLFAAHVAGFHGPNGITSAQFGGSAVVPLPATAWLLLSGISLVGPFARKRRRAKI